MHSGESMGLLGPDWPRRGQRTGSTPGYAHVHGTAHHLPCILYHCTLAEPSNFLHTIHISRIREMLLFFSNGVPMTPVQNILRQVVLMLPNFVLALTPVVNRELKS